MSVLVTLCARAGSKGIPGKNIKPLNGKPLIAYTIETALAYAATLPQAKVALSTDGAQILRVAGACGLHSDYLRPDQLASDTAGKIAVISDLLKYEEDLVGTTYEYVVDLDVTSPLRTVEDIQAAMDQLVHQPDALNLFSVSPPRRNPYFNMVEEVGDFVRVVKQPEQPFLSRQASPKVYDINGSIYIYRKDFFLTGQNSATTDRSLGYLIPHVCFDLDEPIDFEVMEYLLANNKLDFEL